MAEKTEESERQSLTNGEDSPKTEVLPTGGSLEPAKDAKVPVEVPQEAFEGPEKLLEVWFLKPADIEKSKEKKQKVNGTSKHIEKSKDEDSKNQRDGLRSLDRKTWEETLKLVRCTILNVVNNEHFDAYLLSESSLLVWPQKIILKTCGTTTLLSALPTLLQLANKCGLTYVGNVFYSRRNFFFQAKQLPPHSSFDDEVRYLDGLFSGSSYILGRKDKDTWYLYLTDGEELFDNSSPPTTTGKPLPKVTILKISSVEVDPDYTLEILMTNLDETVMKQFYKQDGVTAKEITKSSGIADLFPKALIDDYLFDPLGYSMNGLLGDGYFTIHITPQPICSYVSFETNLQCDFSALIEKVLKVFIPDSFTVTLFAGHVSKTSFRKMAQKTMSSRLLDGNYCRRTYTHYGFENNYDLAFALYGAGNKRKDM